MQPTVGLQPSTVQLSPSSQSRGVPGRQLPETQVSSPLHGLPSEHCAFELQVQPGIGAPAHCPALQMSPFVQMLPSLQVAPSSDGCSQLPALH